jgi:Lrp/AsnC family transcriptional regulator, leucine-responsive regulatory protein
VGRVDGLAATLAAFDGGNQWHEEMVLAPPVARAGARSAYHPAMLDRRDLEILGVLQRDGRATYAEIAGRVGLSPSSVHQRVRKLEQAGVIKGYRAAIDLDAVGLAVTALVSIMPLDPKQPDDLPDRVLELPEVVDCFSVAGDENYVLKVRTKTTTHLEDLLRQIREKAGVQTRTTVVLSIPFEDRPVAP